MGPHPSVEGRGTAGLELHGEERGTWRGGDGDGGVEGRMNETSTTDAVDVRFKLRSHAQSSCSILAYCNSIRKIKLR